MALVPGRRISSRRSHIVKCRRNASTRITKIRGRGRQVHTYITFWGWVYFGSFAPLLNNLHFRDGANIISMEFRVFPFD